MAPWWPPYGTATDVKNPLLAAQSHGAVSQQPKQEQQAHQVRKGEYFTVISDVTEVGIGRHNLNAWPVHASGYN